MRVKRIPGKILIIASLLLIPVLASKAGNSTQDRKDSSANKFNKVVASDVIDTKQVVVGNNNESKDGKVNLKKETIKGLAAVKEKASFDVKLPNILVDDLKEGNTYLDILNNEHGKDQNVVTTFYKGSLNKKMLITLIECTKNIDEIGEIGEKIKINNMDVLLQNFSDSEDGPIHALFVKDEILYQIACEKVNKQKLIKFLENYINQL